MISLSLLENSLSRNISLLSAGILNISSSMSSSLSVSGSFVVGLVIVSSSL